MCGKHEDNIPTKNTTEIYWGYMCGIMGIVGGETPTKILLDGLQALEYRGYDSAGIACVHENELVRVRQIGEVRRLRRALASQRLSSSIGIAHTRWATHGIVSEENAHPHTDCSEGIALVHNGVIERSELLRRRLTAVGHMLESQTDSELIAHLLEDAIAGGLDWQAAFASVCASLQGSFALAAIWKMEPDTLLVARKGSPLVVGVDEGRRIVSSDPRVLRGLVPGLLYLNDGEMAMLRADEERISSFESPSISVHRAEVSSQVVDAHPAFKRDAMRQEIEEQPDVVKRIVDRSVQSDLKQVVLQELLPYKEQLIAAERIVILGCGSAYYAGQYGAHIIQELVGLDVCVEFASEFQYRRCLLNERSVVIAVSQSGETADTIRATQCAKASGAFVIGLLNVPHSTLGKIVDVVVPVHAGGEQAVASTKAFFAQALSLLLFALFLSQEKRSEGSDQQCALIRDVASLSRTLKESLLLQSMSAARLSQKLEQIKGVFFLGRGAMLPVALEGALKLQEVAYVHTHGYGSGEMKHGPIALIDSTVATIALLPSGQLWEKVQTNIQEIQARSGWVVSVGGREDTENKVADIHIDIPTSHPFIEPLYALVFLQYVAYHSARIRGLNADRPRNLAKSVTVE